MIAHDRFNSLWKSGQPNPFYLSTGDNTGYGQHGDYVFGWQKDSLQKAMDRSGCMVRSFADSTVPRELTNTNQ